MSSSGISGLSFGFPFLSALLFFCRVSCSFCLVIFSVHSPDFFFSKNTKFSLRVRILCIALFEHVVCAACCHMALVFAIWHWYLPYGTGICHMALVFAIWHWYLPDMHSYNLYIFWIVYCFFPLFFSSFFFFPFFFFPFFSLIWYW